jgi:uncharacterized protein (TIGR00369 family)
MNEQAKMRAIEAYRQHSDSLPDSLGVNLDGIGDRTLTASLIVTAHHLNPAHTSCHAATMVALADTACGWGCLAHLPENATSITAVDLSCNLLGAVTSGAISCEASMLHGGRTTQVWDAIVSGGDGRRIAAVRCTELLLY